MHKDKGKRSNEDSRSLEDELLIASVSLDQTKVDRIPAILENPLDWSLIIQSAIHQGILPIFCLRILSAAERGLPPKVLELINAKLQVHRQSIVRLTWKLVQCVEALTSNGIETIILKGPILALQAYGDLNMRQFSDLDILIHQTDFPKVYDLLVKSGYTPVFKLDDRQKNYIRRTDNHFQFKRQGDMLEVHWEIGPLENIHPLTAELMWQEINTVQLFDKELWALSLENTILFLCLHGAKHGWKQLKWIVDLAYISRSCHEDDWIRLIEQARRYGLLRQVCLGLLLAEELVDAALPTMIQDNINEDRQAELLASKVKAGLFGDHSQPSLLESYLFYLQTRERWGDRLHYLIELLLLPKKPDWLMITLPENIYILYYLIRPIRLIYLAGKAAFHIK